MRHSPHNPTPSETLSFALSVLGQSRVGFKLCGPLQSLLLDIARTRNIPFPSDTIDTEDIKSIEHFGVDDILDATTRMTFSQPMDQIGRYIDPSIGQQWNDAWQRLIMTRHSETPSSSVVPTSGHSMEINSLLNS